MKRYVIFANPIAGRGLGRATADALAEALVARGAEVEVCFDRAADAQLAPGGVDAVVCVGGDGSLRDVIDRLLAESDRLPPVLTLPMGTANLMGLHLGLDRAGMLHPTVEAIQTAVEWLGSPVVRYVDLARVNKRLMLVMAGVGFDAEVVHEVHRQRRGPIWKANYLLPTLQAMSSFDFPVITVTDGKTGEPLFSDRGLVFIGNIAEYGAGFAVTPHAKSDDRLIDICCLPCHSAAAAAELALQAATGDLLECEGVVYARLAAAEISSSHPARVQIDGDDGGYTPVEVRVIGTAVPMIVGGGRRS